MAKYRVLQGIDYPPNKRAEIGAVVEDLPAASVKWLLEVGAIEDASKPAKKIEEPVVQENRAIPHSTEMETAPQVEEAPAETEVPALEESEAE